MKKEEVKKAVREGYAKIAKLDKLCYGSTDRGKNISKKIGYTDEELKSVPKGANLSLGCGNPVALAASKVGKNGRVIGIDLTPEMIENAIDIISDAVMRLKNEISQKG